MNTSRLLLSLLILLSTCTNTFSQGLKQLQDNLTLLASHLKAEVGIAAIINQKDTITINNHVRYPLMSVFKFHQAIAVAHHLEKNHIPFDSLLYIKRQELQEDTYSPFRDAHPKGNTTTIEQLLQYTLLLSDNNACDILFSRIFSVQDTDAYIRSLGIKEFSIKATEADMYNNPSACYHNWSSPLASVQLLEKLLDGTTINGTYQNFIINTMLACKTGQNRIPAFPHSTEIKIGHKTGTGDKNPQGEIIGINDIGFILFPDGQRITIAIFVKDSDESLEDSEKIIATATGMIYDYICH